MTGDKLRTRHIHASLYARDNLPIPLDRCDLRMLERAYIIEARETAAQSHYYEREKKTRAGDQHAPETWITCGTTLCPSALLPPPPPPTLSSNASAAQVVFVAVPRATRTMQRFVMGEKYFTLFRVNTKRGKKEKEKKN
jgi:hypothetical protein